MSDTNAEGKKPADDNASDANDPAKDKGAAAGYRPEGLPDHYAGGSDQETIDKLFAAVDGYRKKQSKPVAEKFEDYKIELPEEVSSVLLKPGEDGKDPVWEHMRGIFHKNGIAPEAAVAIVSEFVGQFGSGEGSGEGEPDWEYASIGGAEKAKVQVDGANAFLTGLKSSGKLSDGALKELTLLTAHSEGLAALSEIRSLLGDKHPPVKIEGKSADDGDITEEKLQAMMQDERYWKSREPEYIAKVTEGFQKLYANKA